MSIKNSFIRRLADYIAMPFLCLLIFGYCGLIFLARSYLGLIVTSLLLALGAVALSLLLKGYIQSKRQVDSKNGFTNS